MADGTDNRALPAALGRLIDALAAEAAEDYLRTLALSQKAESTERTNQAPLPPLADAA